MASPKLVRRLVKTFVFFLCLSPAAVLLWRALSDELSANPIADITNETGIWTLRFLLIGLALTPLRILTGWTLPAQLRRMIGLFAFFYVCLHFTTFIWLDKFFDLDEMLRDVAKRKFITVGFTSFVLLIPLALTSTDRMMKKLGGKRWKRLHKLVFFAATGGVIHYLWLVKADTQRPIIYGTILLVLLGFRFWKWLDRRPPRPAPAITAVPRAAADSSSAL
jgi:sulfoxide reductase heme-binding subunit YedZ